MTQDPSRYWFPAKRYGWGWGMPRTWQGWGVIGSAILVIAAASLMPSIWRWAIVLATVFLTLLICIKKGEPTQWRWGER